jgi:hypothetical protein
MPFCTIVEWEAGFDAGLHDTLTALVGQTLPDGCLTRIAGIAEAGAHVVEIWASPEDAHRFSEASTDAVAAMNVPPPDRVSAFETAVYQSR